MSLSEPEHFLICSYLVLPLGQAGIHLEASRIRVTHLSFEIANTRSFHGEHLEGTCFVVLARNGTDMGS